MRRWLRPLALVLACLALASSECRIDEDDQDDGGGGGEGGGWSQTLVVPLPPPAPPGLPHVVLVPDRGPTRD